MDSGKVGGFYYVLFRRGAYHIALELPLTAVLCRFRPQGRQGWAAAHILDHKPNGGYFPLCPRCRTRARPEMLPKGDRGPKGLIKPWTLHETLDNTTSKE